MNLQCYDVTDDMLLTNKSAIVTGGTAGIGEAIALCFALEGAKVAVVASGDLAKAKKVVSNITTRGGIGKAFRADVTKTVEIDLMVNDVVKSFGNVDILVNAAGIVVQTLVGNTTEAAYQRIMDTNLKGTFFCINAVVPQMIRQRSGNIINVSSIGGLVATAGLSIYCASKAGVISITKAVACELAPHGIRVNAIAPGHTATPGNYQLRTDPKYEDHIDSITKKTPSGQTFSAAEDMARAALFLASKDSRAMYGSVLTVDEGYTAGM